jgi:hypothetical protein
LTAMIRSLAFDDRAALAATMSYYYPWEAGTN